MHYLEYKRFFGSELCNLKTIVPLLLPADNTPAQEKGLPHGGIPHPLLLQENQGSLLVACIPREGWLLSHLHPLRGWEGTGSKCNQENVDGAHLDREHVSPVGLSRLGEE